MKMIAISRSLGLALACFTLLSCAVNPVTGTRELSLISPQDAMRMGIEQYPDSKQSQGGTYYLDPALNAYISAVGQKLAAVSDVPNLPYEFVVLNNGVPNAWALPGGKIAINRGLLVQMEDEAQLASVLGHEIVHAAANHGASRLNRNLLLSLGMVAAGIAAADSGYSDLVQIGSQIGGAAWMARYGREDELVSDHHGMIYMSRAGYDPQGAVELQQIFVRLSEGRSSDFISGLFASHPPSQARVDANRALAQTLPAGGARNQTEYQRALAQLRRDQPAYDAQDKAVEALRAKKPGEALTHVAEAIRIQPNEGQFWEVRGHAYQAQGEYRTAETSFSTAIEKNPNYFQHWLVRGLLRKDRGWAGADADIKRAQDLMPTQAGAMALGQMAEAQGDHQSALGFYRTAASGGGPMGNAATMRVIAYEMPSAPDRYIAVGLDTSQGQIRINVGNNSPLTAGGIRVRLTEVASGRSRDFSIPNNLASGARAAVSTGIAADPALYRAQVIAASPR